MPQSCTRGALDGLVALGLVSAGCHGLMKVVWRYNHAAVISVYLCIISVLHVCMRVVIAAYNTLSLSAWEGVRVYECVGRMMGGWEGVCAWAHMSACMHISVLMKMACARINQRVFEPTGSSLCDVQEKLYESGGEWEIWRLLRRFSIWDCQTCWN